MHEEQLPILITDLRGARSLSTKSMTFDGIGVRLRRDSWSTTAYHE